MMQKASTQELGLKTVECPTHGEYQSEGKSFFGNEVWSSCPQCKSDKKQREADDQKEKARRAKQLADDKAFEKTGVVPRYRGVTLENFGAKEGQSGPLQFAKKFVNDFERMKKKGQTLIFCGTLGTGKTRLVSAIIQSLGFGRYVRSIDISRDVRDSITSSTLSERQVVNGFVEPELLVIDEVGVQAQTDNAQMLLTDIIDRRYGHMRPTIVVSNLNEKQLASVFGARAWDRLSQNCLICPMVGGSHRA